MTTLVSLQISVFFSLTLAVISVLALLSACKLLYENGANTGIAQIPEDVFQRKTQIMRA
jgi:hypothetical protein